MKKTDQAFWLTIIPAVLVWNLVRGPLLKTLSNGSMSATSRADVDIWGSAAFAGVLAFVVGYVAGMIARPQCMRGAGNIAFGLFLTLGVQNFVDYRGAELAVSTLILAPTVAAAWALIGGWTSRFHRGGASSALP